MEVSHAKHKVYKIRYHIVVVVKYRKKVLYPDDRISFLKHILSEITERYDTKFETIGTDGDHMHLFVNAPPKYSPSRIIQITKSITGRKIVEKFPEIKENLWGGEFWSDGGYIGTVGDEVTATVIRNYILRQGSHEEKKGFKQFKMSDFP